MIKEHLYIPSSDKEQQLHFIVWKPESKPVSVLQIVHGMEEYIDRYDSFAKHMVALGWAVIGHDHLGHGQSGNYERGHFSDCAEGPHILVEDIYKITCKAKELWPDAKLSIMGHSMGSFLTRRYLCEHSSEVSSAVIMGSGWYPSISTGTAYYASLFTIVLRGRHVKSKILTSICSAPFLFAFRSEGKNAWLSVDKPNADAFTTDPLRGFGFTAGAYQYMYKNLLEVSQHKLFDKIRRDLPVLFISGENDKVGGADAVRKMAHDYQKRGFTNVSQHIVADKRHELFFENNSEETMKVISNWLTGITLR